MFRIIVSPLRNLHIEGDHSSSDCTDLYNAFTRGSGHGLLFLDIATETIIEEESISYWRDFTRLYLSLFTAIPELNQRDLRQNPVIIALPQEDLARLLLTVPAMKGAEYVNEECLLTLWRAIETALLDEIQAFSGNIVSFFAARHSSWNLLGRVCFHLAENKNSQETPFAFLATYVHQIKGKQSKHLPLKLALEEYSVAKQSHILLKLLSPIHKASQESMFLKTYVDSGDIYHPLAWTAAEAYKFLKDTPLFEKAGIVVKIPNWWQTKHPNIPKIKISIGENEPVGIGFAALMDFNASLMLGDTQLNQEDIEQLLLRSENLVFFKGQWVEVDKARLEDLLTKWQKINKQMDGNGITFAQGLRWLSGIDHDLDVNNYDADNVPIGSSLTRVVSGSWLEKTLTAIKDPQTSNNIEDILAKNLHTTLRPYQNQGVMWLDMLNQLKLGAILADDMGLGKTIQVISLLLLKQQRDPDNASPSLLIVPTSLIGNWQAEITRFAPSLQYWIAHPSANGMIEPSHFNFNLLITTYGSVTRLKWLIKQNWNIIILDEAQAIKNPVAQQTKAIKLLNGAHKLALTGTPVENRLSDLWSLFDFISPGLLGTIRQFDRFIKKKNKEDNTAYAALRSLVSPYILRRMKTDKKIISDLPDKPNSRPIAHYPKNKQYCINKLLSR